jgi:transcriptional regulator with XRE-family HTH domain
MKDRIAHILKTKRLTATKFADDINVQRSGISHILSGRNKPSLDLVIKIKETYPEFSLDWLLMGNGPATLSPQESQRQAVKGYQLFDQTEDNSVEVAVDEGKKTGFDVLDEPKEVRNDKTGLKTADLSAVPKSKTPLETEVQEGFEGAKYPKISRIIVFYENKTFDSYNPAD